MAHQYVDLHVDGVPEDDEDVAFVRRHLATLSGLVLDLGCGPGHWSASLHALGVDVIGVDMVPEFIAHARATHPGPRFELGSMTYVDAAEGSVAGVLAWCSTIHLPRHDLDRVLVQFHRLLAPGGCWHGRGPRASPDQPGWARRANVVGRTSH